MSIASSLRKAVLGISPREVTFARRGFAAVAPARQERLEQIGRTFLHGYHTVLASDTALQTQRALQSLDPEVRGFAWEGAAMAGALLDGLSPGRGHRVEQMLHEVGPAHAYMLHVGVGWAAARLPWVRHGLPRFLQRFDPLLRWLIVDGFGFHQGYFHCPRHIDARRVPSRLTGYTRRVFDQGLGRSLWFVRGAGVSEVVTTISQFPVARRGDLWSGVGLACAYAGGVSRQDAEWLHRAAGCHRPQAAQGAAFAAQARRRAGNMAPHTQIACEVLCGMTAEAAAQVTDQCLPDADTSGLVTAYEQWRCRIQARFADDHNSASAHPMLAPAEKVAR